MTNRQSLLINQVHTVFADMEAPHHPGAAVLVIEKHTISLIQGYGLAHLGDHRPIDADTAFYLASLTKPFTAMAIMLLVNHHLLTYEDRLRTYLPDLPGWADDIKIHHVLHHTAGLPDYFSLLTPDHAQDTTPQFANDVAGVTNADVLQLIRLQTGLASPVGEQYHYSNTGYVLLAMLVETISGQSFAAFMQHRIFAPLGMEHTLIYDATHPIIPRLAHGYLQGDGQYDEWQYPLLTVGDGGMFSTLEDLARWEYALAAQQLVPAAALEQAFTAGICNDGQSVGYGFGWMTNVYSGMRHVAHGGSLGAYNNYLIRFLDRPLTIVVLCNHRCVPGPRIRAHRIAEMYLR